jgi:hypothetical protein
VQAAGAASSLFFSASLAKFLASSSPVRYLTSFAIAPADFPSVPNSVLGGVTTFLFGSVVASGLRVLCYLKYTRRDRFILAAALSFGLGDLLVPDIFTHLFDNVNANKGLQGFLDSITIILDTPCSLNFYELFEGSLTGLQFSSRVASRSC